MYGTYFLIGRYDYTQFTVSVWCSLGKLPRSGMDFYVFFSVPDPWRFDTDPNPCPALFEVTFMLPTKSKFFFSSFLLISYVPKVHMHQVSKISYNKSQNCRIKGFYNFFCLMIWGSGFVQIITNPDRGSLTPCGSGSGALVFMFLKFFDEVVPVRYIIYLQHIVSLQLFG